LKMPLEMELDNLKTLWDKYSLSQSEKKGYDVQEIRDLLKGDSNHAIEKLKRSVRFELYISLPALIVLPILYFFIFEEEVKTIILCAFSVIIGYLAFYWKKLTFLNQIDIPADSSMKEVLSKIILKLEKYIQYYYYGYWTLIPLAWITGFALGIKPLIESGEIWQPLFLLKQLLILGVISYASAWILKKYTYQLYGVYLEQLKKSWRELVESENLD